MVIVENAAKGLFAEAERLNHGEHCLAMTLLAARIALRQGLICRSDGHADLADVETFLRNTGSPMHLLAMPRTEDLAGNLPYAVYDWLNDQQAEMAGEPNFYAIVAKVKTPADRGVPTDFVLSYQGITPQENLRRLGYAGLPQLRGFEALEDHLLTSVPPLVP